MIPDQSRSVFKYFELADRFLKVRLLEGAGEELRVEPGLDRMGYRRAVIQACLEEYREGLDDKLDGLGAAAPEEATDLLYQLCVAVNPGLEIHSICLPAEDPEAAQRPARRASRARANGYSDYLRRLRRRAGGLERRLGASIFGQDRALATLTQAVRRAAAGLASPERPLGCFLFSGRTGTGKTELARTLARELLGGDEALLRIDCSEFALAHEYSKLIGAPPGYVGHEEGGVLTEALLERADRVVLFDEVEKAHPRLHNLLLQVMEDGHLTDSHGKRVGFERCFVLLTSNAGADEVMAAGERVGFGESRPGGAELEEISERALRSLFAPEFLGRIDETVVFRELDPSDARRIARRQLEELAVRARRRGARVCFTTGVADWVARRGFAPESGAREIRRVLRREVEGPLATALLEGNRRRLLRVSIRGGRVHLRGED